MLPHLLPFSGVLAMLSPLTLPMAVPTNVQCTTIPAPDVEHPGFFSLPLPNTGNKLAATVGTIIKFSALQILLLHFNREDLWVRWATKATAWDRHLLFYAHSTVMMV